MYLKVGDKATYGKGYVEITEIKWGRISLKFSGDTLQSHASTYNTQTVVNYYKVYGIKPKWKIKYENAR